MVYELLDSGNNLKLEQVGPYRLVRQALNAFWRPLLPKKEWDLADGVFIRDASGYGEWQWKRKVPAEWEAEWGGFKLLIKPTNFGHLGFFAEQYENWARFDRIIKNDLPENPATLNLFAYSGIGSMAMAKSGAKCCHLDASKGMIEWGRANLLKNPEVPNSIRWIADDVTKFCNREVRRGVKYNGIALDPPSFGRGSSGQVWKIEEDLPKLLKLCGELLDFDHKFFVSLSCHSPGFSQIVLENLLREAFGDGKIESGEMTVPERTSRKLPAGVTATIIGGRN